MIAELTPIEETVAGKELIDKGIEKGIEQGLEKGIEQGIEKGKKEVREQLARKLEKSGMPIGKIAEMIDLSIDEVKEILAAKQD